MIGWVSVPSHISSPSIYSNHRSIFSLGTRQDECPSWICELNIKSYIRPSGHHSPLHQHDTPRKVKTTFHNQTSNNQHPPSPSQLSPSSSYHKNTLTLITMPTYPCINFNEFMDNRTHFSHSSKDPYLALVSGESCESFSSSKSSFSNLSSSSSVVRIIISLSASKKNSSHITPNYVSKQKKGELHLKKPPKFTECGNISYKSLKKNS